jgi:hypothetical protein
VHGLGKKLIAVAVRCDIVLTKTVNIVCDELGDDHVFVAWLFRSLMYAMTDISLLYYNCITSRDGDPCCELD